MRYAAVKETSNKAQPIGVAHGGDIECVAAQFGIATDDLLDFSANINPLGPPSSVLRRLAREAGDAHQLMRYPDIELRELRSAISAATGIEELSVVIANGAAALIDAAVRAVKQQTAARCLLPVPSFSEYRRALDGAGYTTVQLPLDAERDFRIDTEALAETIAHERPRLCIVANPHNPSGSALPRDAIEQLLRAANSAGTFILLDEAFIDYLPAESLTSVAAKTENLIVLRSLTKFYGMPALRVGYAVATPEVSSAMHAQIPSWPVTTLAAGAALEALRDTDYAVHTRKANVDERSLLALALTKMKLRVFPSAANFLLVELPQNAPPVGNLRARLIQEHQIIVRDCSSYEGLTGGRYLRVAVRSRADNERLIAALSVVLTSGE